MGAPVFSRRTFTSFADTFTESERRTVWPDRAIAATRGGPNDAICRSSMLQLLTIKARCVRCGVILAVFPPTPGVEQGFGRHRSRAKNSIIIIASGIVVVVLCMCIAYYYYYSFSNPQRNIGILLACYAVIPRKRPPTLRCTWE